MKAWVVGADMGFGHARAARPLRAIAMGGREVNANDYPGIPRDDRKMWTSSEASYNFISRFRERGGAWGRLMFAFFDRFQTVYPLEEHRDEHRPTSQLRELEWRIRHGWGKHLIDELAKNPLPLVTTFFTMAHMAEYWEYPGPVYVVTTDTDISRAWAPVDPSRSRLVYFASTPRAAEHLSRYGIERERIVMTGFPLPPELTRTAAEDYRARHARLSKSPQQPVTVTFAVGGAGAQTRIGELLGTTVADLVHEGVLRLNLVAGVNRHDARVFERAVRRSGHGHHLGGTIRIVCEDTKEKYFERFNEIMRTTDVLWTKPSELSFYAALGIPIIIAPPLGSQEDRNREWLLHHGAGIDEQDPEKTRVWLPELLKTGALARAAEHGWRELERGGTDNIIAYVEQHHRNQ